MVLACVLLTVAITQAGELTGPERMYGIAKISALNGVIVTPEEIESLKAIQPLLLKLSDTPDAVRMFWPQVRGYEAKEIPWSEAQDMIVKGKVRSVMQAHSLAVTLQAENGAMYFTKDNSIDEVHAFIKRVDPMGVFIQYATE